MKDPNKDKQPAAPDAATTQPASSEANLTAMLQAQMAEMQSQIAALKEHADATTAQNEQLRSETAALKKQLEKSTQPKQAESKAQLPKDTFEVDGVKYRFRVPRFRAPMKGVLGGVMITAVDALADTELLKGLVASNSGVIAIAE